MLKPVFHDGDRRRIAFVSRRPIIGWTLHHDHSPLPVVAGQPFQPLQPSLNELSAVKFPDGQVATVNDGTFPTEACWLSQQQRRLQGKRDPALAVAVAD